MSVKLRTSFEYLAARATEPSTFAGLSALLTGLGLSLSDPLLHSVMYAAAGLLGMIAMLMPESST